MEINLGEGIGVDAQAMLTGRCCVIGQSGSGKSYLVGVIAEELSRNSLPYIIIDTEGEYNSLKSAFNILWVGGEGADLPINVDYEKLLRSSIKNRIPIVFDVSDEIERQKCVEEVLSKLYSLEEKMRSPYLVIIEEADKFSPQILHKGLNRVEEISVRGRKRGIGLIVATQRPANINKNVLAQCSYGFIGKLTIENDLSAVNILFDDKKELSRLPTLKTGEFVSFGLGENARFKVKQRTVKHGGSTPTLIENAGEEINIASLVKELKGVSPAKKPGTMKPASGNAQTVIKETVSEEFARAYATRALKKKFLIFGDATESLENMSEKYIPMHLAKLRVPTGRRNEFEERSLLIDGKLQAVMLSGKVERADALTGAKVKLSPTERKLLPILNGRRTSDIEKMARENGVSEGTAFKAIDRLEDYKLISINGDRIRTPDRRNMLMSGSPDLSDRAISDSDIAGGASSARRSAEQAIALAFPNAVISDLQEVYLPFYEITLRKGDKVRVFRIDAVFGKELDPKLLG